MNPSTVIANRYELVRKVGAGGMGSVWRGNDRRAGGSGGSGQAVAIKLLTGRPDAQQLARFEREAAVLAQLADPAIVRYLAHGVTPAGVRYLVMEWLEGESLSQRLASGLTARESVLVVARAARALAAAHRKSVVHRDIKPSNIFLVGADRLEVKLIDFGVARRRQEPMALTSQGALVGSPGYMAPEQAGARGEIDGRADTFALGCVLYECLSGSAPFAGEHLMAVLAKVILSEPVALEQLRPELPKPLTALVAQMLAKAAAERPGCEEVAARLEAMTLPDGPRRPRRAGAEPATEVTQPTQPMGDATLCCVMFAATGEEDPGDATELERRRRTLDEALASAGVTAELLADGTALARLPPIIGGESSDGGDAARAAARLSASASSLRRLFPSAALVLACRRQDEIDQLIDGGARAVGTEMMAALVPAAGRARRPADAIAVDDVSADLLAAHVAVQRDGAGAYVVLGSGSA